MPSKGRRPKKAANQSPPLPTLQFRILSRPSSSGKDSSNCTPDLSEFEAPPNAAKEEVERPNTIPVGDEITTKARPSSWPKLGATHLAEESNISTSHGTGMKRVNSIGKRSTLAKKPELNLAGSNITPTTDPLPQSKHAAIEPTTIAEVSVLPAEGGQTTHLDPALFSEAKTEELLPADETSITPTANPLPQSKPVAIEPTINTEVSILPVENGQTAHLDPAPSSDAKTEVLLPADENKVANASPLSHPKPESMADSPGKLEMASSPTPRPIAHNKESNNPASQSHDGETTKPDPTLPIQLKGQQSYCTNMEIMTSSASPAKSRPKSVDQHAKSNASAVAGTDKEAATHGTVNNLADKSTPKAKRTNSYPRPVSRPNPMTPLKKNVTPSQAYAGPTFLASPAASSLPIPKFLSKSVPDKRGSPSLKAAVESRARKSPPNTSEESPTLRKSALNSEFKADASSAQDIFLQENQVDRPQANRQDNKRTATENSSAPAPYFFVSRPVSSSVSPKHHGFSHTRNATEGSIGGLFPMDIDDQKPSSPKPSQQQPHWTPQPLPRTYPGTLSSSVPDRPEMSNEERKARSLALKRLLQSPLLQPRGSSAATDSETGESLRQEFSSSPAVDMDPEARKRPQYRGFPASPGQAEPEATNTPQYGESPSTSGQMGRPQYRGFSSATGQMESKKEQLPEDPLLHNLPGPPTTSSSPGVRPANQYKKSQLIPHTVEIPLMPNVVPNGPARSHSSPSNLAQQATIPKAYNRTNLSKPPTGPTPLFRDNSWSSHAPWNQPFSQYRDISPFAPSVLSAHSAYFCFEKEPIRDSEVTRSVGEYLQRVIS